MLDRFDASHASGTGSKRPGMQDTPTTTAERVDDPAKVHPAIGRDRPAQDRERRNE
jgi:hypothetical protein